MHVTIVQLSTKRKVQHHSADDVFGANESKFSDGVEEHEDKDRQDDIDTLLGYLGKAVKSGKSNGLVWLDIDREAAIDLFRGPFDDFLSGVSNLHTHDLWDFATGGHGIKTDLQRLNEAYSFDGIYILDDYGNAQPISDWLRCVIGGHGTATKYYVHATYDGDQ